MPGPRTFPWPGGWQSFAEPSTLLMAGVGMAAQSLGLIEFRFIRRSYCSQVEQDLLVCS
jgi:hypothetical protein